MANYTGKDRRVEPDLDIKPGGKYSKLIGQTFYSQYSHDKNIEKHVPSNILAAVHSSEGRLEIKIRSVDDDDDCFTEFRIKAVERRKNKQAL